MERDNHIFTPTHHQHSHTSTALEQQHNQHYLNPVLRSSVLRRAVLRWAVLRRAVLRLSSGGLSSGGLSSGGLSSEGLSSGRLSERDVMGLRCTIFYYNETSFRKESENLASGLKLMLVLNNSILTVMRSQTGSTVAGQTGHTVLTVVWRGGCARCTVTTVQ